MGEDEGGLLVCAPRHKIRQLILLKRISIPPTDRSERLSNTFYYVIALCCMHMFNPFAFLHESVELG